MSTHRDERVALALGILPPEQAQDLRTRIAADPQESADLAADETALTALLDDLDLSAVRMPEDAGARLLARVQAERAGERGQNRKQEWTREGRREKRGVPTRSPGGARRPFASWGRPFALGLVAAGALALVLRAPADLPDRYARVPGAAVQSITAPGGPLGHLIRLPDGRTFVHLNRPPEPGRTYQLWRLTGGQPESLGVFGEDGLLTPPLRPGTSLAVTVEPPGGSAAPTTRPLFAQTL